ncbi:MAG: protoporphyrinogen oxidase [Halanaeroarchaeum sp.]
MTVGVVGAGMSGLAVTHALAERDVDVRAFDAASEPGGVMRSKRVDGHVLETGPQRLRRSGPVDTLIGDLNLEDEVRVGHDDQPLYAYYDGSLRPMPLSLRTAVTTDLLSWRGKARILLEPLTRGQQPDETVAEFLTRKFGREAATRFMGPLYSGLYGTEADEMYVEYSLGRALDHLGVEGSILTHVARRLIEGVDTPPIITFEDGVQTLPTAMYEAHRNAVALDTPVTAVERDGNGYRIETTRGDASVSDVVYATPAPTTASLLESVDASAAETVSRFTYNPIGVVHLESAFDEPGHGFHVIDDGFDIDGSTWNHSMLDREGMYTVYVGSGDSELLDADDAVIGRRAARQFETVTGAGADVVNVSVVRPGMPAYDRSWTALDELVLPDGIYLCSAFTSRAGIVGRLVDGTRTADEIARE